MSYDPIINYYDKPGGPSVPGSDSGSGGGEGGSGGGGGVVIMPYEENESEYKITLGMTSGEIVENMRAGKTIVLDFTEAEIANGVYHVTGVKVSGSPSGTQYDVMADQCPDFYGTGSDSYPSGYFGD